jgi:hypothetical protein
VLFPNPARTEVNVRFAGLAGGCLIRLYNATGQLVSQRALPSAQVGELRLDIGELPSGLYTVALQGPHGTLTQTLVVQ